MFHGQIEMVGGANPYQCWQLSQARSGCFSFRVVPRPGKKAVVHAGRVAVRITRSFNIPTDSGGVHGIAPKHCRLVHRGDGGGYHLHSTPGQGHFPVFSHNLRSRSHADAALPPCS